MRRLLIKSLTCAALVVAANAGHAAETPELTPLVEPPLPMPTPSPTPPIVVMQSSMPTGFYRPNRMDVWQYYAVDRNGGWKPRVALSPCGPYYMYNGAPYGMFPLKQMDVIPYIFD